MVYFRPVLPDRPLMVDGVAFRVLPTLAAQERAALAAGWLRMAAFAQFGAGRITTTLCNTRCRIRVYIKFLCVLRPREVLTAYRPTVAHAIRPRGGSLVPATKPRAWKWYGGTSAPSEAVDAPADTPETPAVNVPQIFSPSTTPFFRSSSLRCRENLFFR
jgi:hypothetical protein